VRGRPGVLATERDRRDASALELRDVRVEVVERRRGRGDAGLVEKVLAVEEAAGQDVDRHGVRLAVGLLGRERAGADVGLRLGRDGVGDVHELPGGRHVGHLAAAALKEDVRRRALARLESGLELAVEVLVLDRLDLDGDLRVRLLEGRHGVLEELGTRAGRRVGPERHRHRTVGGAVVPAAAVSAA
jgi:hypothetical protein